MSLQRIHANEAKRLIEEGACLVDVREAGEHARESIPGARLVPLSALERSELGANAGQAVIFHCQSGARTNAHATRLQAKAGPSRQAYVLEGGIFGWRAAGLPVASGGHR